MIADQTRQRLFYQGLFVLLTLGFLFLHLLPLSALPAPFPGPDMLLCFALAWMQRRPDYLPPVMLAIVLLLGDFVLQRPPGLWAVLVLLAAEFLRSRQQGEGETPFLAEWAITSMVMALCSILYGVTLYIVGADTPSLVFLVVQIFMNVAFYPVAVLVSVYAAGLRRVSPNDVDNRGRHS